jgi:hypothetical protein
MKLFAAIVRLFNDFGKTHHCRVDIKTGKIISEFTSDSEIFDDPLLNRTWNTDYGFVEARAKSKTQASFDALSMRRKHLSKP